MPSISPLERAFLKELGGMAQGRCGYRLTDYERALRELQGLIDGGLIRERRLGSYPGFQLTDRGRAYLAGECVE